MKRHATSIVLLVLAVAVGLYAWLIDRGTVTDAERAARADMVFPAFRRGDLKRIELGDMVLVKDGPPTSPWRMTAPRTELADVGAVEVLLRELEYAKRIRKVEQKIERKLSGALHMDKIVYRFGLGGPAPTPEGAAYLEVEGEGTFVVGKTLADQLSKGADPYRDRTVVPFKEIARLEVKGSFELRRLNDTDYLVGELRASRAVIEKMWGALAEVRAEAFVNEPASGLELVLTSEGGEKAELTLGGPCPGHPDDVVVTRRAPAPLHACVPGAVVEPFKAKDLVDRRLVAARDDEVAELRIEAGAKVLDLARVEGGWQERAPRGKKLDAEESDSATALVRAVTRAEGTDPKRGAAIASPLAKIALVRAGGRVRETVLLDKGEAFREADGARLAVTDELVRSLMPRTLRGHALSDIQGRPVNALRIACDGLTQQIERSGDTWTMREPRGHAPDVAGVLDVISAVTRARAEHWVADADDGSFGLDKTCTMAVTTDKPQVRITFGREGEGGVYAQVAGDDAVFVASKALRQQASRVLVDRGAVRVEPEGLKQATLNGKPVRRLEALAALYAEEALHVGPPRKDQGMDAPMVLSAVYEGGKKKQIRFGLVTTREREKMYFARADGVDATFLVAKEKVDALLN